MRGRPRDRQAGPISRGPRTVPVWPSPRRIARTTRSFRLAYDDPYFIRLAQHALPRWRQLEDEAEESLLTTTGSLDHGDHQAIEVRVAALGTCQAEATLFDPAAAIERWPHLHVESPVLWQPDGGVIRADRAVAALQTSATRHGAEFRFDQGPAKPVPDDLGVTVRCRDGDLRSRVAVAAVGAWAPDVLGPLGISLPSIRVTQERVAHFDTTAVDAWPIFSHRIEPAWYGCAGPQGIKVAEHAADPRCHPDARPGLSQPALERAVAYVKKWLPGIEPHPHDAYTCPYDTTPTGRPILDRTGPIVTAAGFSGHGFKFAPLYGTLLADLALNAP